jgi:hemolysin-activating ACP:hemolysin acyltransferase
MLQMDKSKLVLDSLYLFNQSAHHREYTLAQFNEELIFPLVQDKIRVFYDGDKPVSLVTWCWFSTEQADLFMQHLFTPSENDYSLDYGDQLWGLHFIAPYGHVRQTMRNMKNTFAHLYGKNTEVRWPRLHTPDKVVKRKT